MNTYVTPAKLFPIIKPASAPVALPEIWFTLYQYALHWISIAMEEVEWPDEEEKAKPWIAPMKTSGKAKYSCAISLKILLPEEFHLLDYNRR
jgi:hypothetical protein